MRKEAKGLGKDLPFDEAQAGALSRQISDHVEIDSNRNIYYALYPTAITSMRHQIRRRTSTTSMRARGSWTRKY